MGRSAALQVKELQLQRGYLSDALQKSRDKRADATLSTSFQKHKEVKKSVNPDLECVRTLTGHTGRVYAINWSQRQVDSIVSVSQDGRLLVWDALTGFKTNVIRPSSQWLMTCAFSPGGESVACGGLDNACSIYRLSPDFDPEENVPCYQMLTGHNGYISCCRYIPERENLIITASGDQTCILWNYEVNARLQTFASHTSDVMCISPSPVDPHQFLSGSCDATCKLWDTRSADNSVATFYSDATNSADVNSVQFVGHGNCFVAGYEDGRCAAYDTRTRHRLETYSPQKVVEREVKGVTSVETSLSGRLLFVAYASSDLLIWDTLTAQVVGCLDEHLKRVTSVGLCADGSALCTASWDATLKVWSTAPT